MASQIAKEKKRFFRNAYEFVEQMNETVSNNIADKIHSLS